MRNIFLSLYLILQVCFPVHAVDRVTNSDVVNGQISVKNLLGDKGSFEKNALGWSGYDDAAAVPVDGTGGTVTTTCTRTTSTPLSGSGSFLYTPAALGEGCSVPFTVETKDTAGTVLQVSFDYAVVSGTYTDDDTQIWIYDVTAGVMIQPAPYKLKKHTLISQPFAVEFQTTSASTSYRLLIHQATSGTAILKIDNITIGKQAKLYGSAVTDSVAYTPTLTNVTLGTGSSSRWFWWKSGDKMMISGGILLGTGGALTGTATFTLPSGYSIDYAKVSGNAATGAFGQAGGARAYDTSTGLNYPISVFTDSNNATTIRFGSTDAAVEISATVPFTWAAGDQYHILAEVPILGWSSSQIMSHDADTRIVNLQASKAASDNTTSGTLQDVGTWTTVKDSHGSFNATTGIWTCFVPGEYKIYGKIAFAANSSGIRYSTITKNGTATTLSIGSQELGSASITTSSIFNAQATLVAGDTIRVRGYQSSGGTLAYDTTSTELYIERLSGPSQIMSSESISARYTTAAGQSIPDSANTTVDFGTKDYDSHGGVTTGASWKFTARISGEYEVNARVLFNSGGGWAAGEFASISVRKNNVTYSGLDAYYCEAANTNYHALQGSTRVKLLEGDYVHITVYQNSGAALTLLNDAVQNYVEINRIGNY